jgi:hypothetical protein
MSTISMASEITRRRTTSCCFLEQNNGLAAGWRVVVVFLEVIEHRQRDGVGPDRLVAVVIPPRPGELGEGDALGICFTHFIDALHDVGHTESSQGVADDRRPVAIAPHGPDAGRPPECLAVLQPPAQDREGGRKQAGTLREPRAGACPVASSAARTCGRRRPLCGTSGCSGRPRTAAHARGHDSRRHGPSCSRRAASRRRRERDGRGEVVWQFGHRLDAAGDIAVAATVLAPKHARDEGCRGTGRRSD